MASPEQFTVLGQVESSKNKKVKRVLPRWLTRPVVITTNLKTCHSLDEFVSTLDPHIINNLRKQSITHLFPVQATVIPWILKNHSSECLPPRDICVSAPTGSGKTLAFALPIIQILSNRVVPRIRALVVLPVRELAVQVYNVFQTYVKETNLKVGLIVGVSNFSTEQSTMVKSKGNGYESLVDIIIATPGKLCDHVTKTPGFDLSYLEFLVIDEADRMMDEIQLGWLSLIESKSTRMKEKINLPGVYVGSEYSSALTAANCLKLENRPQKLLFSATLSVDPEKLENIKLFQPKLFTSVVGDKQTNDEIMAKEFIGKYTTPAELKEKFIVCEKITKPLLLFYMMHKLNFKRVLCFTNSLETAFRLHLLLKIMLPESVVSILSSNLTVNKRQKVLKRFSSGKIDLLISSDMAARGLDINKVKYVVSYDIPRFIKTYVHRVGRTARAGKRGRAMSLVEREEKKNFTKMMKSAGKSDVKEYKVDTRDLEEFQELFRNSLAKVSTMVKK